MIGKILGGGIGFLTAGPIGALMGLVLGYYLDKETSQIDSNNVVNCPRCGSQISGSNSSCPYCNYDLGFSNTDITNNAQKQAAFITTLIALCAKMAQADGKIDAGEARVVKNFFRDKMNADEQSLQQVKQIFKEALNSNYSVEALLTQWKSISNPQLNYALLDLLYQIAMSDGTIHINEENFINQIISIIGIPDTVHKQIRSMYVSSMNQYYDILGVSPNADIQDIKKAYRALVTQYHPDKLVSKGLPEDMIKFAQEKMNKINEAYEELQKIRKF